MTIPTSLRPSLLLCAGFLAWIPPLVAQDTAKVAGDEAPRIVLVEGNADRGVWQGWGVSLCWWAKIFGERDDLADWLYTMQDAVTVGDWRLPGLGMTVARYNAGATTFNEVDGRRMVRSKTILPFRQIHAFWLDPKQPDPDSAGWDWTADANQREMLRKARERGATHFELFANSPPWWMCANDNPSGATRGEHENLIREYRDEFAHYLAMIARRARDHWALPFTSVAAFNEPSSNYWVADGKQEGSHFSPRSQIEILPLVRAALDREGLQAVALSASDETSYDHALAAWRAYPPEIKDLVERVNVHGYQGRSGDRAGLDLAVRVEAGKPLWNSEHGDPDASGLDMARNFHRDMHRMQPVAWCYWQAVDGGLGGKGGSGWGLLDGDLLEGRLLRDNPKAYVFAQYSRHIRPGMRILGQADPDAVVAFDESAGRLVVAVLNPEDRPRVLRVDLSRLGAGGGHAGVWLTEPFGASRYARQPDLAFADGVLERELPPRSVLTLQFENLRR
jgi:galactan endo-1,6-beta-galactosidase